MSEIVRRGSRLLIVFRVGLSLFLLVDKVVDMPVGVRRP